MKTNQPSFAGGELAPSLWGRVDLARYQTSLKRCRNFISRQYGGVDNRPGTHFVAATKESSKASRLIPFAFSTVQTYALEFGDYYMRVHKDGAQVVYPTGHVSAGQPVEIATPYPASALASLKYTQSADVLTVCHQDYAPRQFSRYDHHDWRVSEFAPEEGPFKGVAFDKSVVITTSDSIGTITISASADIFAVGNVGNLFYLEQASSDTPAWQGAKQLSDAGASPNGQLCRSNGKVYVAEGNPVVDSQAYWTGTTAPSHDEGIEQDGTGTYYAASPAGPMGVKWRYLHSGYGIVRITGVTDARTATAEVIKRLPDALVNSTQTISKTVSNAYASGTIGKTRIRCVGHGFLNGDAITISGVTTTAGSISGVFQITVVDPDLFDISRLWADETFTAGGTASKTITKNGSGTYKYAHAAWSSIEGYPGTVGYYQQRMVFGATKQQPQTLWMSKVGDFKNFGKSTPLVDDDAITRSLVSRQVNEIRHILPLDSLLVLTSGGEWLLSGPDDVLTPSTMSTKQQGYGGCSHLAPIVSGISAVYLQDDNATIQDLAYSLQADGFDGEELSTLANHLFAGREIVDLAYARRPNTVIWMVRDDGALVGLTYMKTQQVVGWHWHDTDGAFESVCAIREGNEDAVYAIVRRTVNGAAVRYVERFASRRFDAIEDAFFVDCGLSYDGRNKDATTLTVSGGSTWDYRYETFTVTASTSYFNGGMVGAVLQLPYGDDGAVLRLSIESVTSGTVCVCRANRNVPEALRGVATADWRLGRATFSGLSHLEGKTVSILADGSVHPQQVVSGGAITLQTAAAVVHAGLPYLSDLQTLDLSSVQDGLRAKVKNVPSVTVLANSSRGLLAGTGFDADALFEVKQRDAENYDQPIQLRTGLFDVSLTGKWETTGSVCIRQEDPLPLSVLSIMPDIVVGG